MSDTDLWVFKGFASTEETGKLCGSVFKLLGAEPEVRHILPIYDHPEDVQIVDGRSYIRKPPVWEDEMEAWLREQDEFFKTFDSLEEYAAVMRTALAIVK